MPNKLKIFNASPHNDVVISVWSPGKERCHADRQILSNGKTTEMIVTGGVKRLVVEYGGDIIWEGMIPSYGASPITIAPEKRIVEYKNWKLLQLPSQSGFGSKAIVGIVITLALMVCLYFFTTRRK